MVRGGYYGSEMPKSLSSVIRSRTQYEHGCRLAINADGQPGKIVATSLWITMKLPSGVQDGASLSRIVILPE